MKCYKSKDIYICLLLCFFIGTAAFGYFMYLDKGALVIMADFNAQQIPFLTALNQHIKQFTGSWCWNVDRGTQIIGAYSFYNIGSPFVWITFLFPKSCIPYLMGWLYILKYMIAGVTAYLYLKMFVKNSKFAILGGILYSFSGFQSTNLLFFHFHDVVAFFPLLLIGLEKLVNQHKKTLFICAVFLNCITNYFFFISEVIFLVIYYLLRFWDKNREKYFKNALICFGCGCVGVGMAAILFLPSILYILGNSRTHSSFDFHTFSYYIGYILFSAKGALFPAESMSDLSCIMPQRWTSDSCYLPMLGGAFAIAYILKKKNTWLTRLIVILWIFSCSPTMDSLFYLFTEHYKRWWFMFVLMLILASILVLDSPKQYPIKTGIIINMTLLILFTAVLISLNQISWANRSYIYRKYIFGINCGISFLGLLLTWLWHSLKKLNERTSLISLFTGVSVFCAITTFYALSLYRHNAENAHEYLNRYQMGLQLKNIDDQYRYNLTDNVLTFTGEAAGIGSFSSTVSHSIHEFNMLFDFKRGNTSLSPGSIPGLKELLGAKYQLTEGTLPSPANNTSTDSFTVDGTTYYIAETDVCPIGFTQDTYITKDELKSLPVDKRGIAMLDNLIIDAKNEALISSYLSHNNSLNYSNDYNEISSLVSLNQKNRVFDFTRNSSGFQCNIELKDNKAIFFSVPYDDGWHAFANGEKINVMNCGGMTGILLSPGNYSISFKYKIPGLKFGIWLSILSSCIYIWIIRNEQRKNKKETY